MKTTTFERDHDAPAKTHSDWLIAYYFIRAAVSFIWVGAALTVGAVIPIAAAVLIIFYPAWDAAANLLDAYRNGGARRNPSQLINAVISLVATVAFAVAMTNGFNAVLGVFGAWAVVSGLLQLATAVRRWKMYGAQWLMFLSGAQSALAGGFFIKQAAATNLHGIADIVPYVAFGAFYFLVSALWLVVSQARRRKV
ncbi:DUF308 domain-containing protein [Xanthomonas sp. WHRI 1810A]|uniref:DUF308 domain-containing protein n=1 Tax=Xanthomonas sp. WHRI 1810A TaxID=3161565 RepID=UPI0032E8518E